MTLKYEEIRAQERVREFLKDLLDGKKTPRVPMQIRLRARSILRHLAFPDVVKRGSTAGASPYDTD